MFWLLALSLSFSFANVPDCVQDLIRDTGLEEWTLYDTEAAAAAELREVFALLLTPDHDTRQWWFDLPGDKKGSVRLSRRGEAFELGATEDAARASATEHPLLALDEKQRLTAGLWMNWSNPAPLSHVQIYIDRPDLSFVLTLGYGRQRIALAVRFDRSGRALRWLRSVVELQIPGRPFQETTGTIEFDQPVEPEPS